MAAKLIFLIKIAIFIIGTLSIFYVAGYIINYWLKIKREFCRNIVTGFIFQVSVFELVALPFMLVKGSFYYMITCYAGIMALFYLFTGFFLIRLCRTNKIESPVVWLKEKISRKKRQKWFGISLFSVLFVLFAAIHIGGVTLQQITMGDDAYYVTLATYAIEHDTLETNTMFVTTGLVQVADIRPNISAWEYYVAFLSVVFDFHPAQMFHFLLPLILIPMSYMAYREVIKKLFTQKKIAPYLMWFAVLSLFFSFSNKLNSYNMFNCPWMGKVVLYNILMPMFLASCINIIKAQKDTLKYWICIVFIMCAGICATVVGVYMIPIYYAVIGITYAITIRSWDEFKKLIFPVILTIIPIAVMVVVIFSTKMGKNIIQYAQTEPKNYLEVFVNYWGISINPVLGYCGLFLFIVSSIVIWFRENHVTKIVLCGITIFSGLTIVNPLFIKPVSSYLTGADLYWRMFIILPVVYVLPYLFTQLSCYLHKKVWLLNPVIVLAAVVLGTAFHGSAFSNKEIFTPYESTYGIKKECVTVSDYLLERTKKEEIPNVLYPKALREGLRQYTTKLNTLMGRNYYHGQIATEYGNMTDVYKNIYHQVYTEKETYEVLKKLDVDYIVVNKKIKYKKSAYFKKLKKIGKFCIYQVNE